MTRIMYKSVKLLFGLVRVAYQLRYALLCALALVGYLYHPAVGVFMSTILITTRGKEIIVDRIMGAGAEPKYVHWGTGAGAAAAASVGLSTPSAEEARTLGTSSKQTTTTANDTYRVVGQIVCATSNKTITNIATFDDIAAGNMCVIVDGVATSVVVSDSITSTFNSKLVSA